MVDLSHGGLAEVVTHARAPAAKHIRQEGEATRIVAQSFWCMRVPLQENISGKKQRQLLARIVGSELLVHARGPSVKHIRQATTQVTAGPRSHGWWLWWWRWRWWWQWRWRRGGGSGGGGGGGSGGGVGGGGGGGGSADFLFRNRLGRLVWRSDHPCVSAQVYQKHCILGMVLVILRQGVFFGVFVFWDALAYATLPQALRLRLICLIVGFS